jgi:hypothetical protein
MVRSEGTAAMVPLVMMKTFKLPSAPDRDFALGDSPGGSAAAVEQDRRAGRNR